MKEVVFTIIYYALKLKTENVKDYASYLSDLLEENKEIDSAGRLRKIISGESQSVIRPQSG